MSDHDPNSTALNQASRGDFLVPAMEVQFAVEVNVPLPVTLATLNAVVRGLTGLVAAKGVELKDVEVFLTAGYAATEHNPSGTPAQVRAEWMQRA